MPDKSKQKFHEFALQSVLFKGRADLYFCYLKTEKIAHALAAIFSGSGFEQNTVLKKALYKSAQLPGDIAQFAAHASGDAEVLASIFELLSLVRVLVSEGLLSGDNALVICREYEQVAEKIALGKNASPFLTIEDFAVPTVVLEKKPLLAPVGDSKGHIKDMSQMSPIEGQDKKTNMERSNAVLDAVIKKQKASIKDISLAVRGCSEKTIQRELNMLIQRGLIRKEGERRWSIYIPVAAVQP